MANTKNKPAKGVTKKTIGKILKYIKKYIPLVILSLILAAVIVVFTLYIPILIGNAVDLLLAGKGNIDFDGLFKIMTRIGIVMLITALAQWVMNTINNHITYHVVEDIRNDAMEHLHVLPLSYLDTQATGDIVSRVVADVDTFADGLLMGFTQLFTGVMTILGTLIFMLRTSPIVTIVVVVITPLSFFVAKFIATHTHDFFQKQSEVRAEQTALIDEMIGNQKIVKIFSREEAVKEEFNEINNRLQDTSLKAVFYSSLVNPSTRFVNSIVYAGVAVVGGFFVIKTFGSTEAAALTVGELTCFLSYANQYTKPFNEISGVITELQNAIVCASRIFELIEAKAQVPEAENAVELKEPEGTIVLKGVEFRYVPDRPLIRNFGLDVKPGQRVAIVGPTGCGKTTVINLLMRFYDVDEGSISVDGVDIRELTRKSLRSNYGMVLQETWLKAGTIKENICMGKPDATDEEIIAAAKAAHSHGFIKRLPNGYNTVIGEDGGMLSQGQKQLLCITRVMLCLPPMLILDEATSSIDTRTEIRIQKAFAKLMQGRTSFIVAHRLSTIKEADIILVMKDGNIIEQGNHESLLAKGGFYAELYNSQFAV
ncbi:MAG: ABC transporter ATP-binding protein/permease [Lachnospiraceae bacterium]|nr:ABC transporter ATP-binding protein/permease [Lachnospiraceae bacterium]